MLEGAPFRGPAAARRFNVALRDAAQQTWGIEPLIGGNAECGLSYTTGHGGTDVPYPAALAGADPSLSQDAGRVVCADFSACGYSWVFQPVVDVRSRVEDPVIGVRSFGSDPAVVATHASAYLTGVQSAGVLACAKHFPGHGDAETDSHLGVPTIHRTRAEHEEVHLPPFRTAIEAGVDTIMTAHVQLPALGEPGIATFSSTWCTDVLRGELGFEGLLVTDSLRMQAVASTYTHAEAIVAALAAGCDLMNVRCWPDEVPALLDDLSLRAESGELTEQEIRRAFDRVVAAQARVQPPTTGPPPGERTAALRDPRLTATLRTTDPTKALPLPIPRGGRIGLLVAAPSGDDAPALSLAQVLATQLEIEVLDGATSDVDAVLVISYYPAGPNAAERALADRAAAADVPAALLLAASPENAPPAGTLADLPAVAIPAVDVFGIASLPALAVAAEALVRIDT